MIRSIHCFLFAIFHPSFWKMDCPYSAYWDEKFRELMRENKFVPDKYQCSTVAIIGGVRIWLRNYPNNTMTLMEVSARPSRLTIYQANKKLTLDLIQSNLEKAKKAEIKIMQEKHE